MLREPFYLTTLDPGGITGITTLRIEKTTFTLERQTAIPHDPARGLTAPLAMPQWAQDFTDLPQILLYEDFHVRNIRAVPDTTALNVIGGLETWLAGTLTRLVTPTRPTGTSKSSLSRLTDLGGLPGCPYRQIIAKEPLQAKHIVPDDILERLGLLARGPLTTDINDSARHAVSWLADQKYLPLCRQAWPTGAPA